MGGAMPFPRTVAVAALLAVGTWFALSDIRLAWYGSLLPFFEWMETTLFAALVVDAFARSFGWIA